jgi:hypothetical protein
LPERAFEKAGPDDFVTLYHGTTAKNAKGILAKGFKTGFSNPESGTPSDAPAGIYLAPDAKTARNYTSDGTVVAVKVRKSLLNPDETLKTHKDAQSSLYHDFQGGAWVEHGSPLEIVGLVK